MKFYLILLGTIFALFVQNGEVNADCSSGVIDHVHADYHVFETSTNNAQCTTFTISSECTSPFRDLRIALSDSTSDFLQTSNFVEIFFTNNKITFLQNDNVVKFANITTRTACPDFWFSWNRDGTIQAGVDNGTSPILSFSAQPNSVDDYDINYLGYLFYNARNTTLNQSNKCKVKQPHCALDYDQEISTQPTSDYLYLPAIGKCFTFSVVASPKVSVALSTGTAPNKTDPMIEIIFDTNNNVAISVIRGSNVQVASLPNSISSQASRSFWITWSGNKIQVGIPGNNQPILSYTYNNLNALNIKYIGLNSLNAITSWYVNDNRCPVSDVGSLCAIKYNTDLTAEQQYNYFYLPTREDQCFSFQLKSDPQAWIALSNDHLSYRSNKMVEIIFGDSIAIRTDFKNYPISVDLPSPISAYEFKSFWVSWKDNTITAGNEPGVPLISYDLPEVYEINFIGLESEKSRSLWKLRESECYEIE